MVINVLIFFFYVLIINQIMNQIILGNQWIEGLENNSYQGYDTNNPGNALILAQKNAGNIEYIKQRLDELQGVNKDVKNLTNDVHNLQDQVTQLLEANQKYTTTMVGSTPPQISGV